MHEYRRFIQDELDARGWGPPDLVKKSGLRRQLVWKILHDERESLGQMPDESTMDGIATGFGIPVERVRAAAARSLSRFSDDGAALSMKLADVHIDALLAEVRRRVVGGALPVDLAGGSANEPLGRKMGRRRDQPKDRGSSAG